MTKACQVMGTSRDTIYRYRPVLSDQNEEIAERPGSSGIVDRIATVDNLTSPDTLEGMGIEALLVSL